MSDNEADKGSIERLIAGAPKEPSAGSWPKGNPDGTISEKDYLQRCRHRVSGVGQELDSVRGFIKNEADAKDWLKLKQDVSAVKAISDPYKIVDPMIELEKRGYSFAKRIRQ